MTDGDRAAVDVDDGRIPAKILVDGTGLGREGLIGFDEVEIADGPAGLFQRLAGGRDRAGSHNLRIDTGGCPGNDAGKRLDTAPGRFRFAHQHRRGSTIAERTVVMLRGEAVETGTTEEIFNRAHHPYTRALLHAVPVLGSMKGQSAPQPLPIADKVSGDVQKHKAGKEEAAATGKPLLVVRNLTTRFDIRSGLFGKVSNRIHAVENVSFDLRQGETLSLVGESGCGKSTIGRSIMRLIEPKGGSVHLCGEDVMVMPADRLRAARRNIQMIFQDPFASLSPRRTVGQAIAEPFLTHGLGTREEAEKKVVELLEQVGLEPAMAGRLPHQFSGGQRQRICIARALALSPKMIVADESVAALDVSIKAQVINLMMDLQKRLGISYLFISHDMAVVERISHRVAVIYLGEIVEIGTREEIFSNPQHAYTRKLLDAVPIPDPERRKTKRRVESHEVKNPIRPVDYMAPERAYRQISSTHSVMDGPDT